MKSSIRNQLDELARKWISEVYADHFNATHALKDLIVLAFVNQVPEGPETRLLREAHRRLCVCALQGDFDPGAK